MPIAGQFPRGDRSVRTRGQTRKEAARQLKVPEGTVAGWLARAKKLLAKRLSRHRNVVSAGTVAVLLAQNSASAKVPSLLMDGTVKAATLLAAGQNAAGVVLPGAVAISEGVMKAMFVSQCKTAALAMFAPLVCTCLAIGAVQTTGPGGKEHNTQTAVVSAQISDNSKPADPATTYQTFQYYCPESGTFKQVQIAETSYPPEANICPDKNSEVVLPPQEDVPFEDCIPPEDGAAPDDESYQDFVAYSPVYLAFGQSRVIGGATEAAESNPGRAARSAEGSGLGGAGHCSQFHGCQGRFEEQ